MPEGMSIWQGRNVSCDGLWVLGWLYEETRFLVEPPDMD